MRFGIRPQVLLLTVVPVASLLVLVALSSLLVRQTEQRAAVTQQLAEILELSDTMTRDVSTAIRSAQAYVASKNERDLAPYHAARVAVPQEARRFTAALRQTPALLPSGTTYARNTVRVMEVLGEFVAAFRRGGRAATGRIVNAPATKRLGPDLQNSKIAFDRAAQPRALRQLAARSAALHALEIGVVACALAGLALTLLVALLYAVRIVRRLGELGENARRFAYGVPTVPVTGNDEIAELDRLYREMAERIQTTQTQLRHERDTTALLQDALLPVIPTIAGLGIHSAYATPTASAQIGGDWYDVFELAGGRVGLSVGDVTGHGLHATAAMGFVRQAIRVVARRDPRPAEVMQQVNELLCSDERDILVTAFFGVLDQSTGVLRYTLAGHGPPIVARGDGTTEQLAGGGLLLGLDGAARYGTYERELDPRDTLVMYTDGIVEIDRAYLTGLRDLEQAIGDELRSPSANLADGIQRRVFGDRTPRDDAALLVVALAGRTAAAPANAWDFDARREDAARRVKSELLAALARLGPLAPDATVAEIVFGELLSNVVQHTPGPTRVRLGVEDGHVALTVEDRDPSFFGNGTANGPVGHPGPPTWDAENGRGLFLITSLCPHVDVERTHDGKRTTVVLPKRKPPGDAEAPCVPGG